MPLAASESDELHFMRRWSVDFNEAAASLEVDETTRLGQTIETLWPVVLLALTEDVPAARTEGFDRIIIKTKRAGRGSTRTFDYDLSSERSRGGICLRNYQSFPRAGARECALMRKR